MKDLPRAPELNLPDLHLKSLCVSSQPAGCANSGQKLGAGGLVECIHGTLTPSKSSWQIGVLLRAEELLSCFSSECPWFVFVLVDWNVKGGNAKWRDFRSRLAAAGPGEVWLQWAAAGPLVHGPLGLL